MEAYPCRLFSKTITKVTKAFSATSNAGIESSRGGLMTV